MYIYMYVVARLWKGVDTAEPTAVINVSPPPSDAAGLNNAVDFLLLLLKAGEQSRRHSWLIDRRRGRSI
jgi:hypothetical protein